MSKKDPLLARVLEFEVPAIRVRGSRVGVVTAFDAEGLRVDYAGNPHGPLIARLTIALDAVTAARAVTEGRQALLAFEDERSDRPIIVGLITAAPFPVAAGSTEPAQAAPSAAAPYEAAVDGRRLVIEAQDEVVLRCGEASITLRRNGRLAIRGVFIETRARGVNRIKGGTVQIN
jgi:uncharacterized protein DUF6484